MEPSGGKYISVGEFFSGRAVLVTGATGFLGKVLVEKLLRSCPGVKVIYLLMRPKRGADVEKRLEDIINSPLFDVVRRECPSAVDKIVPIQGDIGEAGLGLSSADQEILTRDVSVVFHSAATVKFDEPIKVAVQINLLGTKRVVELCRGMPELQALVHVSTCYSNCDREVVKEVVYPTPFDHEDIIQCTRWMDDQMLETITPKLLGKRPNTYTFTKALTEAMVSKEGAGLPIAIVRPSIIVSTWKDPQPGWVEGMSGATAILAPMAKGVLRTVICHGDKVGDLIPVDVVANTVICAAWRTATVRSDEVRVYNSCSGNRKPLTWDQLYFSSSKVIEMYPSKEIAWYPANGIYSTNKHIHQLEFTTLQFLPAYLYDVVRLFLNKKPIMVRIQKRMRKILTTFPYFTTNQWLFEDNNTLKLSQTLSADDRRTFFLDVADVDWPRFIQDYLLGIRRHIFKENPDTIPRSRILLNRLLWVQRVTKVLSLVLLLLGVKYGRSFVSKRRRL